ncbi:hypothetical protein KM043_008805 [Ampulex compressa]|nr:hypothetical protein KM043_008805 [Ampulex compressa]
MQYKIASGFGDVSDDVIERLKKPSLTNGSIRANLGSLGGRFMTISSRQVTEDVLIGGVAGQSVEQWYPAALPVQIQASLLFRVWSGHALLLQAPRTTAFDFISSDNFSVFVHPFTAAFGLNRATADPNMI